MTGSPRTKVYILTYCRNPESLYGSTLTFRTLRTGFPNAEVGVFDNRSVPEAAAAVQSLCFQNGCTFYPLQREVSHPGFIEYMLSRADAERVVFVDPDVVFWASCEDIELPEGKLFGGRYVPTFFDEYTQTVTLERLHSSLLVFERVAELRERAARLIERHISFAPFTPASFCLGGRWYRLDTCAGLYAAMKPAAWAFAPSVLERYDHLLLGAQMDGVHSIREEDLAVIRGHHRAARDGDLAALKGIYRFQDDYFARRRVDPALVPWLGAPEVTP